MELPNDFLNRMRKYLGGDFESFYESFSKSPTKALRVNTLKVGIDSFCAAFPYTLKKTGIIDEGFIVDADGLGRHPYHFAGLYYLQEPTAMSAVAAFDIKSGMRILDMCASPGGKAAAIAAKMNGNGILVANEFIPSRAKTLSNTIERMGIANSVVISAHPGDIAKKLPKYFDAVLVDAPCSGEGMFRKDERAIAEWSLEHVKACAVRQRQILSAAAETVKTNGILIYSTCTFSKEENEEVIENFLRKNEDFSLIFMKRLYPHTSVGEGHFVCKMKRIGDGGETETGEYKNPNLIRDKNALNVLKSFMTDNFSILPSGEAYFLKDGRIYLANDEIINIASNFFTLRAGVFAGEFKNTRFSPSHSLFIAEGGGVFKRQLNFTMESKEILDFLRGFTLILDEEDGYTAVAVDGFNVGFGKMSGGVLKNYLPKGLRLLN
ncbi:MAG: RsmB/NOP family class I SAM-dependent RNA methyltransferase [Clostridia bacterium]